MLTVYTLEQSEQWDAAVRTFEKYDAYYLSGYVKGFQIHGDGEPLLFFYDDKKGTRGINVAMKRDIAKDRRFEGKIEENRFFDLSSPYGYGGWLIEGVASQALFAAYESWCRKNSIISEFVRYHPVLENHIGLETFYEVVPLGETVTMNLSSPDTIWANIISQCRNKIRKAQKNGISIYTARCPEIFKTFRVIYNETMDKDHADPYYYFGQEFYASILTELPHNAQVFYAVLDGKVIAASIMLTCNGKMNYHLSGSLWEYAHLAPTNLLLYEAALWGCAHSCKTLYLGGGVGSGEDSLLKFKRSFYRGEVVHRFHIGKKIFDNAKYQYLIDLRDDLSESSFFPRYRA